MPVRAFRPVWPLLACLAVALLWPASGVWTGDAAVNVAGRHVDLDVRPGGVGFTVGSARGLDATVRARRVTEDDRSTSAHPRVYSHPGQYRFWCPLWVVTVGAGLFAGGLVVSRLRRARRHRPGCCPACGYDRRASPERCPECGTTDPAVPSTT